MPIRHIDLNGTWDLVDTEHGVGDVKALTRGLGTGWMKTAVPGDIHPTLEREGRIPDPFLGLNAKECTWTGHKDWWYRREIRIPKNCAGDRINLVFDGIDTYAWIYVNGHFVGETANMFLQYSFDVTDVVKLGEPNTVVVRVGATVPILESRDTSKYVACFYTPRIFARKAQCQFSWDWAPHLPGLGIWRGVRIEAVSEGVIEDVYVCTKTSGAVQFRVAIDQFMKRTATGATAYKLAVEIQDGKRVVRKTAPATGQSNFVNMTIPNPKLWWPNGYGDQPLYRYTVKLKKDGKVVDTAKGRFGIREIELVEEAKGDQLQGFDFRVNGTTIFCQGANWVPADCFPGTVGRDHYAHLIRLTQEAHFNMLRVWGGGIYEDDAFYDLCDEQGILVWQDLMFACSDIPDDDKDFALSVVPEFEYQIKRLRNHPCIAHWCGGNEKTGSYGTLMSYGDLITCYLGRGVVQDMVPEASYTHSSPYSLTDMGNDPESGDTHGGCYEKAFRDSTRRFREHIAKKITVFNSEFGTNGPCQMRSLRKFIPEDKLWPLNEVWEEHVQDNPYNDLKETFVQVQEKFATDWFHKPQSAADFVKKAGTFHAEMLHEEFLHHRRRWPENSGALVWMLNDCWPCASWSIIDYYGLPKQVYYTLKRDAAPVVVSLTKARGAYTVYVTSRKDAPVKGDIILELQTVDGSRTALARKKVAVNTHGSEVVLEVPAKSIAKQANSYLYARFEYDGGAAETTWFPNLWDKIEWPDPGLAMRVGKQTRKDGEYCVTVSLRSERYARCVNLATAEDIPAYFSDNFFDMIPGATTRVTIRSAEAFDPNKLVLNHWLTEWDD